MSDSLWPNGLQHSRFPCSSLCSGASSNACPLSQWCRPTNSSSVTPFSFCLQSCPASRSFPVSSSHQVAKVLELQLSFCLSAVIFLNWRMCYLIFSSVQFISVAQSCPTLCDCMKRSTPGLPVHHQLPEFTQIHIHWVSDAIQPSHYLSSPSPPAPNPSQHHSLFQWVNSSHEVAKVLEFQL